VVKLLFISMSARVILDDEGDIYINSHMNRNTLQKYADCCDEFSVLLRDSGIRVTKDEATKKYNIFPSDICRLTIGFNPYFPLANYLNLKKRFEFEKVLEREICQSDKVIIASASGYYSERAVKYCRKYNKSYMLLSGGFAFETIWGNRNPLGKLMAPINEYNNKKNLLLAPYAIYVTKYALQNRYPCRGKAIGCSDVEVVDADNSVKDARFEKIQKLFSNTTNRKVVIGTAAAVDYKLKGQKYVIQALALLKKMCPEYEIEYQLLGHGDSSYLIKEAKKTGVSDAVRFVGSKPHHLVYEWMDSIDIYIQPSLSEGLCRAVVEAMSRGCPVICSAVGGNPELCSSEFLFSPRNPQIIAKCIIDMLNEKSMQLQAKRSFAVARDFDSKR